MYFVEGDNTNNKVELVIEHSTAGSTSTSLYLRIPINATGSPSTSISKYINASSNNDVPFNIDKDLPDNIEAKKYNTDDGATVIVLDSTIDVETNPASILETDIPLTPSGAKTVQLYQDNQIYIDCNPSGESAETIAAYNVPINSEYAKNEGKMNYERQAMYSGVFAIALVLIYFIVPWWYRTYVVESVINWMGTKSISELKRPDEKHKYSGEVRIAQINKWLMFLCGLYLLVNFTIGISSDPDLLTQTTYVAIMIALSVISIIIKGDNSTFFKHDNVQLYNNVFSEGIDRDLDVAIDERATFLSMAAFLPVFGSLKIEGIPWFYLYVGFVFVFIGIFYGLQFGINKDSTSSDSSISKTVFDGIFYSTFVVMLGYMMSHYKPPESDKLKEKNSVQQDKGLFGNVMSGIGEAWNSLTGNKNNKVAQDPDS